MPDGMHRGRVGGVRGSSRSGLTIRTELLYAMQTRRTARRSDTKWTCACQRPMLMTNSSRIRLPCPELFADADCVHPEPASESQGERNAQYTRGKFARVKIVFREAIDSCWHGDEKKGADDDLCGNSDS